jgi:LysM repeat protein/ABC-type branched-subunit amino acid transport system substrate-binding protein
MEIKRITAIVLFILLIAAGYAQPVTVKKSDVKITEGGQTFFIHTIAPQQTLFSIARAYEVDQAEIIRHNPSVTTGLKAGETLKIPDKAARSTAIQPGAGQQGAVSPAMLTHVVGAGETLFGIARRYGVTSQQVMLANPEVTNFETLQIGQVLNVPVASQLGAAVSVTTEEADSVVIHEVQRGESLFGIAKKYQVSSDSLMAWNPELKDKPLRKGQELRIIIKVTRTQLVTPDPVKTGAATPTTTVYDTVLHQIQDKETVWGLARRYNTTAEQIIALNPEVKDGLKKGYYIYIPVPRIGEKPTTATAGTKGKGCENSRYRTKYKVALLIPLYLDEIDRIHITPSTEDQIRKPYFKSFGFIEFYEGMLIAVDSMKRAGLSVDLYVFDTGDDTITMKRILAKPEMAYMDLIIGPFFAQPYTIAAKFAARNTIKIVSPFARNQQLVSQHRNVFQMNASSETKMEELARFIAKTYQDPNIILVMSAQETDKSLAKAFKTSLDAHTATQTRKVQYFEVMYPEKGATGVSTRLDVNKPNIIVNLITGETMISNYVTHMARLTKNFQITMFGMPEWRDYRTFDLNDLMLVNLHLFANAFVDYNHPNTIAFLAEFRDRYKGEPEENYYGFMGYDLGMYFLKALFEFGLDFENCLDQIRYSPISTGFRWEQVNGNGQENIFLNIYRYKDFSMEPVKQVK